MSALSGAPAHCDDAVTAAALNADPCAGSLGIPVTAEMLDYLLTHGRWPDVVIRDGQPQLLEEFLAGLTPDTAGVEQAAIVESVESAKSVESAPADPTPSDPASADPPSADPIAEAATTAEVADGPSAAGVEVNDVDEGPAADAGPQIGSGIPEGFALTDASAELQALQGLATRVEVRRSELLGWMVDRQVESDLERWRAECGHEREPSAARLEAVTRAARASIVDTVVTVCGGQRSPWANRARVATAPTHLAQLIDPAIADGSVTVDQAASLLRESRDLGLSQYRRARMLHGVISHARSYRRERGLPVSQALFRRRLRREAARWATPEQRVDAVQANRHVDLRGADDGPRPCRSTAPKPGSWPR